MLRPSIIVRMKPKKAIPIEGPGGTGSTNTAATVTSRPSRVRGDESRSTSLAVMDASLDVHRPEEDRG
jgi:hypothetical protein